MPTLNELLRSGRGSSTLLKRRMRNSVALQDWKGLWRKNPKEKALCHLERDIQMLSRLRRGRYESGQFALGMVVGKDYVGKVFGRNSAEFAIMQTAMRRLRPLVKNRFSTDELRKYQPVIDSARSRLLACKTMLKTWSEGEVAAKFVALKMLFSAQQKNLRMPTECRNRRTPPSRKRID